MVTTMPWFRRKQPRSDPVPHWPLGKPALSEQEVVGAALLCPWFGADTTVWQLTIDRDGLLRQDVEIPRYGHTPPWELRHEETKIPVEELEKILAVAQHIGFRHYQDNYDNCGALDQETLWLAVRYPDGLKAVQAYAPFWVAARSKDREMLGFLVLWGLIPRVAPIPSGFKDVDRILKAEEELQALSLKAQEAELQGIARRVSGLLCWLMQHIRR
jgi:hypothetical protein